MSKELDEAWTTIYHYNDEIIHDLGSEYVENPLKEEIDIVNNALLELKAIKEAKPSEALERLYCAGNLQLNYVLSDKHKQDYETVAQALIKAQKNEEENAYIEKIKTMMKQKDCVLRYIESEDCFAVKTILSGWYKLTPSFVDNNVREEIKPLPLIEKNKQLKEENAEYKRVLEIIFKKYVDLNLLDCDDEVEEYNRHFGKDRQLTQQEFDLLKEMLKCQNTEITKKK